MGMPTLSIKMPLYGHFRSAYLKCVKKTFYVNFWVKIFKQIIIINYNHKHYIGWTQITKPATNRALSWTNGNVASLERQWSSQGSAASKSMSLLVTPTRILWRNIKVTKTYHFKTTKNLRFLIVVTMRTLMTSMLIARSTRKSRTSIGFNWNRKSWSSKI